MPCVAAKKEKISLLLKGVVFIKLNSGTPLSRSVSTGHSGKTLVTACDKAGRVVAQLSIQLKGKPISSLLFRSNTRKQSSASFLLRNPPPASRNSKDKGRSSCKASDKKLHVSAPARLQASPSLLDKELPRWLQASESSTDTHWIHFKLLSWSPGPCAPCSLGSCGLLAVPGKHRLVPGTHLPLPRAHRLRGPHRPPSSALLLPLPKYHLCRKLSAMAPISPPGSLQPFSIAPFSSKLSSRLEITVVPRYPRGIGSRTIHGCSSPLLSALRIHGFRIRGFRVHGYRGPTGSCSRVSLFSASFPRSSGVSQAQVGSVLCSFTAPVTRCTWWLFCPSPHG